MIISLSGKAGAGKGTVASYLKVRHGFRIVSFAQPIRSMLIAGLNLSPEDFESGRKEQPLDWLGKSPRQLAQTLGTEWGRNQVDKELWTTLATRQIAWLQDEGFDVVVDDTRFDNEAQALMELDAVLVKITRTGLSEVAPHTSEHGLSLPDDLFEHVRNNGTIDELREQVDAVLASLMPGAEF